MLLYRPCQAGWIKRRQARIHQLLVDTPLRCFIHPTVAYENIKGSFLSGHYGICFRQREGEDTKETN
jgi:hypothetical protein